MFLQVMRHIDERVRHGLMSGDADAAAAAAAAKTLTEQQREEQRRQQQQQQHKRMGSWVRLVPRNILALV